MNRLLPLLIVATQSLVFAATPGNAPQLPITGTRIVSVSTEPQLQTAMGNLQAGDTILIADGTYNLTSTLYINGVDNVTIRGTSGSANVVLVGKGMDNASYGNVEFGIWSNSKNTTIAHLTIRDTYDNTIILNYGAHSALIYSVTLINSGSQFVKSNPVTNPDGSVSGNTNGILEYSVMEYTGNPPADHGTGPGYTNGISAHAAQNWTIRGNLFQNFHTPDTDTYLWNPAVLMWNHSANTLVEQNTFINVDRAVAFGLQEQTTGYDHSGGTIRNNFVTQTPGLFSATRTAGSDGLIIVWDSPNSVVYHNTVLTNGNTNFGIEFRFPETTAGEARNNLADAPINIRDSASVTQSGNLLTATPSMFVNPAGGDLHLLATASAAIDKAPTLAAVTNDFDGDARPYGPAYDIGADEWMPTATQLTITTGSPLPNGSSGSVYTQIFSASGGTSPYTWSVSSGTLPPGLALSSGGLLNGTPTTNGTFNFTVKVTDSASATATANFALTIGSGSSGSAPPPTVTSPPSANPLTVTVSVPENFSASATDPNGGTVTYTWNFGDGTTATGSNVTHTYLTAGPYTVTVTMTTSGGGTTTSSLSINVISGSGGGGGGAQPVPMTVSKAQGSVKFTSGGHDACSFSGVIPGVAAGFNPSGQAMSVNFAGATDTLTLDKKGHGKNANGTIALKLKLGKRDKTTHQASFIGGNVPFSVKLTNGNWAATWNFNPTNNANKQPVQMTADVILVGTDYQASITVVYSAKANVSGKFKK
jgi:PKD repeat protein